MANLDEILSGQGAAASETPETVEKETPAVVEQAQAEPGTDDQQQEGAEGEQGQKMVPQQALHAEKQKVKRYTEQVASFEKTMAEQAAAVRRLEQQLLAAVMPKKEEPKPAPDFWENPDEFLKGAIAPLEQKLTEQAEKLSMRLAVKEHGRETVQAAYSALGAAMQAGDPNARVEYQRIKASDDPYGDIVEWHKRAQAQAEIGSDPEAYKAKLKAEILAELQAGNGQQQQQAQPGTAAATVMPTDLAGARNVGSRSGPPYQGPASLNDIFDRSRKPTKAA